MNLNNNINTSKSYLHDSHHHNISTSNKKSTSFISKIFNIFKSENKPISEIIHLGGTNLKSLDRDGTHLKVYKKKYFFEGVPLRYKGETIFIYGMVLETHFKDWKNNHRAESETFQDYMEKKMKDSSFAETVLKDKVRYFNDTERKQTLIHFNKKGKMRQIGLDCKSKKLKKLEAGSYAFVIGVMVNPKNPEKTIEAFYATPKVSTSKGKIQHSSFFRGGNSKSVGMMQIDKNGKITSIQNHSGHYRPSSKDTKYLLKYLKAHGHDTSHIKTEQSSLFSKINSLIRRLIQKIN